MIKFKALGLSISKSFPNLVIPSAGIHSHVFNRNIQYISDDQIPEVKNFEIKHDSISQKPLVLLYPWLVAKDEHVMKYAKFYMDLGANILKVRITPFDLLRPTKGSQIVAEDVLQFLHANPSTGPVLLHGFSVGAYLFCESMAKVSNDIDKHGPLLRRFVGQIWDSPVDIYGIPSGFSKAVTKNKVLQKSFEKYLQWYLKFNYETATKHYQMSSQMMHANTLGCPGLFLFSHADVVSDPPMNMQVVRKWEEKGVPVFTKCFDKSVHVSHFIKYRTEYLEQVATFLDKIGLVQAMDKRDLASVR